MLRPPTKTMRFSLPRTKPSTVRLNHIVRGSQFPTRIFPFCHRTVGGSMGSRRFSSERKLSEWSLEEFQRFMGKLPDFGRYMDTSEVDDKASMMPGWKMGFTLWGLIPYAHGVDEFRIDLFEDGMAQAMKYLMSCYDKRDLEPLRAVTSKAVFSGLQTTESNRKKLEKEGNILLGVKVDKVIKVMIASSRLSFTPKNQLSFFTSLLLWAQSNPIFCFLVPNVSKETPGFVEVDVLVVNEEVQNVSAGEGRSEKERPLSKVAEVSRMMRVRREFGPGDMDNGWIITWIFPHLLVSP
uniref:Tim44-like domain-containing protein n=1 Tax=Amorphochlora amoebiformis TaxID=1561963 RepID=A0A7S0DNU2_9EUKA|mmetsp:Transcript_34877/g.56266  ORF Transcript_34877/g.56266 Transcript_34877/m.56266 type:complete len:295 (+) Transcript_34877:19-903(+)